MLSSAFARSRPLMARYDVSPHMTKWWKAVRPDEGQVSNFRGHLSARNGGSLRWAEAEGVWRRKHPNARG